LAVTLPILLLGLVTVTIGLAAEPFVRLADEAALVLVEPARYVAAVFPELPTSPAMLAEPVDPSAALAPAQPQQLVQYGDPQ
jgi:hypothetical protein